MAGNREEVRTLGKLKGDSMNGTTILLGTNNLAKQRRLRWLLEGLPLIVTTPRELGLSGSVPDEDGQSHEDNARLKAIAWSRLSSMPAIASDGGLMIPALGQRWESLHTHRFAGPEADDQARRERLLRIMEPYTEEEREASWVEALAIAYGDDTPTSWQVDGPTGILLEDVDDGPESQQFPEFWVFSVWYFPQIGKTYNQLDNVEMERLNDHWSQLQPLVQHYFRGTGMGEALKGRTSHEE